MLSRLETNNNKHDKWCKSLTQWQITKNLLWIDEKWVTYFFFNNKYIKLCQLWCKSINRSIFRSSKLCDRKLNIHQDHHYHGHCQWNESHDTVLKGSIALLYVCVVYAVFVWCDSISSIFHVISLPFPVLRTPHAKHTYTQFHRKLLLSTFFRTWQKKGARFFFTLILLSFFPYISYLYVE